MVQGAGGGGVVALVKAGGDGLGLSPGPTSELAKDGEEELRIPLELAAGPFPVDAGEVGKVIAGRRGGVRGSPARTVGEAAGTGGEAAGTGGEEAGIAGEAAGRSQRARTAASWSMSTGLGTKSLTPASNIWRCSSRSTPALKAMTGSSVSPSRSRIWRVAAKPSSTGICMSMSTASKPRGSRSRRCTAC